MEHGMKKMVVGVGLALLVPAGATAQQRCEFREVVELSEGSRGDLHIRAQSGSLEVQGREGIREVQVTATLCASDQDNLDELGVRLETVASGLRIETEVPRNRNSWRNNYARIDLLVLVPAGSALNIEDGAGRMEIVDVGDLSIEDGSGEIVVRNAGAVRIDDSSGGIEISGARGDVEVEDGSGGLEIQSVEGNVVLSDGSGGIEVRSVTGSVRVKRMGSGGVRVDDVGGDLVVESGRRERIRYSDVRGELDLPPARRRGRGN